MTRPNPGYSEAGFPLGKLGCHTEVTMPTANWVGFNPLYRVWQQIRWRCTNPKNMGFKFYGARGIGVYPDWLVFTTFHKWALEHGYKPGLTIERIDNNGDYCPSNCTFVTRAAQARNRRNNLLLTAFGETKTLAAWGEDKRCSVSRWCLRNRVVVLNIPVELAMSLPTLARGRGVHANSQFQRPLPDSSPR